MGESERERDRKRKREREKERKRVCVGKKGINWERFIESEI